MAATIGQGGLLAVADEEQIAEHLDLFALLALAQKCGHRHLQMLAQQIK